jgi:hypothetical protein
MHTVDFKQNITAFAEELKVNIFPSSNSLVA